MMIPKYTTLRWIWFWGIMTFILLAITDNTKNNWTFVAGMVTAFLVVVGTLYAVGKWAIGRYRLHQLFEAYYEPNDKSTIKASKEPQYVRITLKMKTEVHLASIDITVEDNGGLLDLRDVSEGYSGGHDPDIHCTKKQDGSLHLTVTRQRYRYGGQIIRLSIYCRAPVSFDGNLGVSLSSEEGIIKKRLLPLKVETNDA